MTKKLPLILAWTLATSALGYVPEVKNPIKPTPRPQYSQSSVAVKEGVFHEGVMKLVLPFYNEGIFYQRDQREQLIPILYYLKNEYPNVDFSSIRLTRLNINTRTLGDFAFMRFYSDESLMLKESFIPKVQNSTEAFSEFINAGLSEHEIQDILYVGVSGIQNINNISATFKKGSPNFSLDLNRMPSKGNYVGQLEGFQKAIFSEATFEKVMKEVRKMSTVNNPTFNWQDNNSSTNYDFDNNSSTNYDFDNNSSTNYDFDYNDNSNSDYDFGYNNSEPTPSNDRFDPFFEDSDYYNPTPNVIPYRERSHDDVIYNSQVTHQIKDVGFFGGTLALSMTQGSGELTGYQIERRNRRPKYTRINKFINPYKRVRVKLKRGDSDATITFFFSSITKDATTFIIRER